MLTTVARVRDFLRIDSVDFDGLIADIIGGTVETAEAFVGRKLALHTVTLEPHQVSGDVTALVLHDFPVQSITTVVEGATTLVAADYRLEPNANTRTGPRLLSRLSATELSVWNRGACQVTYDAGYSQDDTPKDLALAMTRQAAHLFNETPQGQARLGVSSVAPTTGSTVSVITDDWLPGIETLLSTYRGAL